MLPPLARLSSLVCLALLGPCRLVAAEEPQQLPPRAATTEFLRLSRDEAGEPLALETAVVRYTAASRPGNRPIEVDLVAAGVARLAGRGLGEGEGVVGIAEVGYEFDDADADGHAG